RSEKIRNELKPVAPGQELGGHEPGGEKKPGKERSHVGWPEEKCPSARARGERAGPERLRFSTGNGGAPMDSDPVVQFAGGRRGAGAFCTGIAPTRRLFSCVEVARKTL